MDFLPIFLQLRDRDCLVVGGGEVAARKIGLIRRAGGRVTVIAPELCTELAELMSRGEIVHRAGEFRPADVDAFAIVVAATGDTAVNTAVSAAAHARNIPVNVVDAPGLCSFIFPSIVDRSPVLVAVSSGGTSPVLARQLRARLETMIPAGYGRLAELLGRFRVRVGRSLGSSMERRRFWERILHGPASELVLSGREREAEELIERELAAGTDAGLTRGEVYLIGAGPGDPDLLTFRALRLMQQADVVLYDRLVSPEILDLVRREAERVYVGKRRDYHALRQEEINRILVEHARQGRKVVRLKGGDPFIFGRGGEEIASLAGEGIPFQVVPGITAANGCAAYAGIPLTHRDYAQSVVFVTGHSRDDGVVLDWSGLVLPQQTLAIYMGLARLDDICRELVAHGMSPAMPAALIEQGTTRNQRVIAATLESLPQLVAKNDVHAPTLLIVGEVVRLHQTLAWFSPG
ncbi:MAG: uroporphyrinogen-III C-methyltransferase [Gammaproteobacteria bacterium]|nr:uroporphyrinogen-III C-methyltransferase [Gammaproteobacteria bacterium]